MARICRWETRVQTMPFGEARGWAIGAVGSQRPPAPRRQCRRTHLCQHRRQRRKWQVITNCHPEEGRLSALQGGLHWGNCRLPQPCRRRPQPSRRLSIRFFPSAQSRSMRIRMALICGGVADGCVLLMGVCKGCTWGGHSAYVSMAQDACQTTGGHPSTLLAGRLASARMHAYATVYVCYPPT